MKNILSVFFVLICMLFSEPTYTGANGYIAVPSSEAADAFSAAIAVKYSHKGFITPSFYITPVRNFEINSGVDIISDGENNQTESELSAGLKYQFLDKKASSALGLNFEIPLEKAPLGSASIYWNISGAFASFKVTFLLGYTMIISKKDANFPDAIDFAVGFERGIILPEKIFLIGDFANSSYRHVHGVPYASDHRGVANLGVAFRLTKWLTLGINGLDLFDQNRSFGLNASFGIPQHTPN